MRSRTALVMETAANAKHQEFTSEKDVSVSNPLDSTVHDGSATAYLVPGGCCAAPGRAHARAAPPWRASDVGPAFTQATAWASWRSSRTR
jgi:hypothetical protein